MSNDCQHAWVYVEDWEGDPSLPGGTRDLSHYLCTECELEQTDKPETFEDPAPELEAYYEDLNWVPPTHAPYGGRR